MARDEMKVVCADKVAGYNRCQTNAENCSLQFWLPELLDIWDRNNDENQQQ